MKWNTVPEHMGTEGAQRWIVWVALAVLWAYIAYAASIYLELRDQVLVGWGLFAVLSGVIQRNGRSVPLRFFYPAFECLSFPSLLDVSNL
ncbi:hypothetical protein [Desulfosoma sp.]|uniref:hypothetical protein n=1 Tax=Desulfosoma sp. TaxID=2603217 RepID=UPI00404A79F9